MLLGIARCDGNLNKLMLGIPPETKAEVKTLLLATVFKFGVHCAHNERDCSCLLYKENHHKAHTN